MFKCLILAENKFRFYCDLRGTVLERERERATLIAKKKTQNEIFYFFFCIFDNVPSRNFVSKPQIRVQHTQKQRVEEITTTPKLSRERPFREQFNWTKNQKNSIIFSFT